MPSSNYPNIHTDPDHHHSPSTDQKMNHHSHPLIQAVPHSSKTQHYLLVIREKHLAEMKKKKNQKKKKKKNKQKQCFQEKLN